MAFRMAGLLRSANPDGSTALQLFPSFAAIVTAGIGMSIIDIPIGLPDAPSRACDPEARQLIGARRNSVFPAPIRAMLSAGDYLAACKAREAAHGKRCSKQLFAILPKIREVDELMTPQLQGRIREGHPEVSFTLLNGGVPMREHKSIEDGKAERLALLRRHFHDIDRQIELLRRPALTTDALDAYALLWSARRAAEGCARSIPDQEERDARGLRVEMVA
jgi:predicted RNase H-like nuclease